MGDEIGVIEQGVLAMFQHSRVSYLRDPVSWIRTHDEEVWSKQAEIAESVRDNRYTAVHSAHDLGKSFIASRIIAWWIDSHPVGSAFVVSTAPSAAQVSAIMWREVGKIHKHGELMGKINRAGYPQWFIDNELVGYGRKPADHEESAFQGIHAQYPLIVIDEACGVVQQIYDAVDALATNQHARVLAIGNPDDPSSHFAKICKPDSGWNIIHLDGLRSPNLTYDRVVGDDAENPKHPMLAALMDAEGIPYSTEPISDYMREMLVNEEWIEERIQRWGNLSRRSSEHILITQGPDVYKERIVASCAGSPLFTAKVRGLFPESATEGAIPLGWVLRAVERWKDQQRRHEPGDFVLGVDVARTGDDQTCFAHRYGSYVPKIERMRITDTTEIADRAAAYLHEPRSAAVVDVIGIGSGVFDLIRRYSNEHKIVGTAHPFNASGQSHRHDRLGEFRFLNDRAAAWWNMREALDPAFGSQVALPDDEDLIQELISPRFGFNAGGTMKIEGKEDIKKRLGRSTDSADAVIAAFWVSGNHTPTEMIGYTAKHQTGGYYEYEGFGGWAEDTMGATNFDFTDL